MTTDTSTDLATRNGEGTVVNRRGLRLPAVSDALREAYPALNPELDLEAALASALGPNVDIRLSDLTRIKVPSAQIDRLMVPDENDRLTPVDELVGLPVGMTSRRSWWPTKEITNAPPACASRDLIHGVGQHGAGSETNPTGLCADCPMAKMGSADTGTNASACKEQRLLMLLTDRELLPLMVVVPAGSLTNHKKFGLVFLKKGIQGHPRGRTPDGVAVLGSAWSAVEIKLSLEQTRNKAGQDYNQITFGINRRLSPDERAVADAYALYVEGLIAKQALDLDNLAAAEASAYAADPEETTVYGSDGQPVDDGDDDVLDDGVTVPAPAKAARSRR